MRWIISFGLTLSLAACRQTVVFDQTGDGGGGGGADASCSGPLIDMFPEFPEVIVVLDRLTGMTENAVAAFDEHAARYQQLVHFGYVEFPSTNGNEQCNMCGGCAGEVSPPSANFEAFAVALHACDQYCSDGGGGRPTAVALNRCADVFGRAEPIRRSVLLITNGSPDCSLGQTSGCTFAQELARDLLNNGGVNTIVIVPGQIDQDTSDCLQRIALQGGADAAPYYHPAPAPADLNTEIGAAIKLMARGACELDLDSEADPDRAALYWKGTEIPHARNGYDGWELTQRGLEVVLHGEWCDRLVENGPGDFQLFAECNPPPR